MKVLWNAWHGEGEIDLAFPATWRVEKVQMTDAPQADLASLAASLRKPIGTPTLKELAAESKNAAIVVEDITRPSALGDILALVIDDLVAGGLNTRDIFFIVGLGAHSPMRRQELILKLGEDVVNNFPIYQNHVHENREYLGETERGTPIYINRFLLQADLRLSVGTIVPHGLAGFAGGVKTVAVGLAGIETLYANHQLAYKLPYSNTGRIVNNELRADLEEIGRRVNHRFCANTIVNSRREIVALFAGDPIAAHRAGVKYAATVYGTRLPPPADIVVFNAYPKDTDLIQLMNSMNAVARDLQRAINADGTAVLATACTHGAGTHYLLSSGMKAYGPLKREKLNLGRRGLIVFSPNLSPFDIRHYPEDTLLCNEWSAVIKELERRHGEKAVVSVFPNAALQIPVDVIDHA
ncbi:MAG: lactate racemase domain-containing protein [Chloroflexi bacterium]|nr:lactate racemase domain-containing protein [Chloroflexota bacterium]